MNRIDLHGRSAVVTGAAQGIGRAIAKRLLESGASVSLWDIDRQHLAAAAKELSAFGRTLDVVVDVADTGLVVAAYGRTIEEFGQVDILVNNAGISGPNAPTWEYPVDQFRRVLDIDLISAFLCCRSI